MLERLGRRARRRTGLELERSPRAQRRDDVGHTARWPTHPPRPSPPGAARRDPRARRRGMRVVRAPAGARRPRPDLRARHPAAQGRPRVGRERGAGVPRLQPAPRASRAVRLPRRLRGARADAEPQPRSRTACAAWRRRSPSAAGSAGRVRTSSASCAGWDDATVPRRASLLEPVALGPARLRNRVVSTSHQTGLVARSPADAGPRRLPRRPRARRRGRDLPRGDGRRSLGTADAAHPRRVPPGHRAVLPRPRRRPPRPGHAAVRAALPRRSRADRGRAARPRRGALGRALAALSHGAARPDGRGAARPARRLRHCGPALPRGRRGRHRGDDGARLPVRAVLLPAHEPPRGRLRRAAPVRHRGAGGGARRGRPRARRRRAPGGRRAHARRLRCSGLCRGGGPVVRHGARRLRLLRPRPLGHLRRVELDRAATAARARRHRRAAGRRATGGRRAGHRHDPRRRPRRRRGARRRRASRRRRHDARVDRRPRARGQGGP